MFTNRLGVGAAPGAPLLCVLLLGVLLLGACSGGGSGGGLGSPTPSTVPDFQAAAFTSSTQVTHAHFSLEPGTVRTYVEEEPDGSVVIVEEVLDETREVLGVTCVVVRVQEFEDELLIEDTRDWYAQDDAGNVWYLGEDVVNYEYDDDGILLSSDTEGSWEAGLDVAGLGKTAMAGWIMKAVPGVGDKYHQEYYAGEAEDLGTVISLDVTITLMDGTSFTCLQIEDSSTLEPGSREYKYFAPGIGLVREEDVAGPDSAELRGSFEAGDASVPAFGAAPFGDPTAIDNPLAPFPEELAFTFVGRSEDEVEVIVVERLEETRVVMSVECVVVRDRVFEDGLLIEDTADWYAQDDDGNVWYMGEESTEFEYDEDDEVIDSDTEGSWEAGMDVAGAGSIAEPGYYMKAAPTPGDTYNQEYYEDEAEDKATVVADGVEVELDDGTVFEDCLQTLEWDPLEPGVLEYKFYAPGVGVVVEEKLAADERVELAGVFDRGEDSIPDFSAATFTDPTEIDHPFQPLVPGTTLTYEAETEDGTETIVVEVTSDTRVVSGVTCVVVRDQVFLDGLLIEDTDDWFAQDDAGNVWYMGEESIEFEYDEDDMLVGTDDDGSWEAGVDGAEPGHQLPASFAVGDSYYQEYFEEEAEDMGLIVATDVTVELEDGTPYTDCLQTLDWNPLEAGALEHKFYAPGLGLVLEVDLVEDARVELTEIAP